MIRVYDHEKRIKQDPVSGAIIASAVIGAGSSIYAGSEARKAQREAEDEQRRVQQEIEEEQKRIAAETRPEDASTATIEFGTGKKDKAIGAYTDFLVPKASSKTAGLSSGRSSGLGFGV